MTAKPDEMIDDDEDNHHWLFDDDVASTAQLCAHELRMINIKIHHHLLPPIHNGKEQIIGEYRNTWLLKDAHNLLWSKSSGRVSMGHKLVGPSSAGN